MFNTQALLHGFGSTGYNRIFFYPSCGSHHAFLSYTYEAVQLFTDSFPRTYEERDVFWNNFRKSLPIRRYVPLVATTKARIFGLNPRTYRDFEKTGVLLFEDNIKTLERIRRAGLWISCFVAYDDGCRYSGEGGRNRCVLENPFFRKVLENADPEGMKLIVNHSPIRELDDLITTGESGDRTEMRIGKMWYTAVLTGEHVWGLPNAKRVFVQRKETQEPTPLFTDEEIQHAFLRTIGMDMNKRIR